MACIHVGGYMEIVGWWPYIYDGYACIGNPWPRVLALGLYLEEPWWFDGHSQLYQTQKIKFSLIIYYIYSYLYSYSKYT